MTKLALASTHPWTVKQHGSSGYFACFACKWSGLAVNLGASQEAKLVEDSTVVSAFFSLYYYISEPVLRPSSGSDPKGVKGYQGFPFGP